MQVEIGNYDSFYDMGIQFSPEQVYDHAFLCSSSSNVHLSIPIYFQLQSCFFWGFYLVTILWCNCQILKLARETRRILPFITLSVTVPHMLSLPDQVAHLYPPRKLRFVVNTISLFFFFFSI